MKRKNKIYKPSNSLMFLILTLIIIGTLSGQPAEAATSSNTQIKKSVNTEELRVEKNSFHREYNKAIRQANTDYWSARNAAQKELKVALKSAKNSTERIAAQTKYRAALKQARASMQQSKKTALEKFKTEISSLKR